MKTFLSSVLIPISLLISIECYSQDVAFPQDLALMIGNWEGSLTYVDFATEDTVTIPAKLRVVSGENNLEIFVDAIFPEEPHANSRDTIRIRKGGSLFFDQPVISRRILEDGSIQIITHELGLDNSIVAITKQTYTIGKSIFKMRVEVNHKNEDHWLMRNEFRFGK